MRNKTLLWLVFGSLILSIVVIVCSRSTPAYAAGPWYVKTDGDDGNVCNAPGNACATINGALGKADPGDTIYVAAGTYTGTGDEVVLLDKDVTLSGGWDESFIIQSGASFIDGEETRGGILVESGVSATFEQFVIQNCDDPWGGAINNSGTLTLFRSLLINNRAEAGGGIQNHGVLNLINTTISGNVAVQVGGGISNTSGSVVTLKNCTVSNNRANVGGGIENYGSGIVTLQNTLLTTNAALNSGRNCSGTIESAGYNLIADNTGCTFNSGTGDLVGTGSSPIDPVLTALQDNGGPTLTIGLGSGSPAIDSGNPIAPGSGGTACEATDERGITRPIDGDSNGSSLCDIGAYEFDPADPPIPGPVPIINTWYVAPGGDDDNECTSPITACASINGAQSRLGYSEDETIKVAIGTYTGSGAEVVLLSAKVTLSGGWNETFTTQSGKSTIDGESARRGIKVNNSVSTMIEHFIVQNANNRGIDNSGNLTLENCVVTGNTSSTGGGIGNYGILTVNGSDIVTNTGGGIYNSGTLYLNNSNVSGNTKDGLYASGGGIYNESGSSAVITSSDINDNIVTGTSADCGGIGGGMDATLIDSTVSGNQSVDEGGGICGNVTLYNTTVNGNSANKGGGIFGGGILNNSTVSGNTATYNGGGINSSWGALSLNNSTIMNNTAQNDGGGIYSRGTVTLQNTILANNVASGIGPDCTSYAGSEIGSSGYNIIGDSADCNFSETTGDLTEVAPQLGPLQDNGGAALTHALAFTSPAINKGNPGGCTDHQANPLLTDQRDFPRVGICDIGAYEYQGAVTRVFLPCVMRNYCAPQYWDDFHDSGSGWPIDNTAEVQLEYLNEEYRVVVKSSLYWTGASSGHKAHDHFTAVDVRNPSAVPGSYGLMFGISDDWGEFYTFEIDRDGNYAVIKYDYGSWSTLTTGWSGDIQTGSASNRIKIERNGISIQVYANGVLLATTSDGSFTGSRRVGLIVSSYDHSWVDIRFDNFTMYPIVCAEGAVDIAQDGAQPYLWEMELDDAWEGGSNTKEVLRGG